MLFCQFRHYSSLKSGTWKNVGEKLIQRQREETAGSRMHGLWEIRSVFSFLFLFPFFWKYWQNLFAAGSWESHSFSSHWNHNPFEVVKVLLLTGKEFLQSQQSTGESQTVLVFLTGDCCGKCGAKAKTGSLMVAVVRPNYVPLLCYWVLCRSQIHTKRGCKPHFLSVCVCLHVCQ